MVIAIKPLDLSNTDKHILITLLILGAMFECKPDEFCRHVNLERSCASPPMSYEQALVSDSNSTKNNIGIMYIQKIVNGQYCRSEWGIGQKQCAWNKTCVPGTPFLEVPQNLVLKQT